jgi:DNA polymerase-2
MFGVLGSPASRLFSPAVANAITAAGRHVTALAARIVAGFGHTVIYGDTDSVFVDAGADDEAEATRLGEVLRAQVESEVGERLAADYGCTSHLQLEFAKVYRRFFMPEVRGGKEGSKKRYAGMVGGRLEIVGLEAVRRDWSGVARRFQRELLLRIFRDEPIRDFVTDFVRALEAGDFDAELVYRKAIRKPLDQYTRTTPPHVKAARKAGAGDARIVRYVMTRAGPEPVDGLTAAPDYDHYVTQQLQPIGDAILRFVPDVAFDELAGLRRQLSLF